MYSRCKELKEKSKKFGISLEDIIVKAESYASKKSVEEDINYLEKLNAFMDSKLQIAEVDTLNKETIGELCNNRNENENYKLNLLGKLLHKNIHSTFIQKAILSSTISDLFQSSTDDNSEIQTFKDNIRKQLDNLAHKNDAILEISEKHSNIIEQITKLRIELKESQNECKETIKIHAENQKKNKDEKYKQNLLSCEKRIEKINFMHTLTKQLLIQGMLIGLNERNIAIFESMRKPVTIDTIKNMADN